MKRLLSEHVYRKDESGDNLLIGEKLNSFDFALNNPKRVNRANHGR